MPPIANQGVSPATSLAWRISSSPAAGRPSLVGVSQTGPALTWSGRASPVAPRAASNCSGECVESPTSAPGPACGAGLCDGRVVLADVNAVGAAGLDELGVIVEEEQRAVLVRGAAERLGQRDELLGAARRLLAQLDHVDSASERRIEKRRGIAVARAGRRRRSRGGRPGGAPRVMRLHDVGHGLSIAGECPEGAPAHARASRDGVRFEVTGAPPKG